MIREILDKIVTEKKFPKRIWPRTIFFIFTRIFLFLKIHPNSQPETEIEPGEEDI